MKPLATLLLERIARQGPISVAEYMAEVLTHPQQGYYMKGDPLGAAGDFTTAPEISQMFGEMIGLWCADVWRRMGSPKEITLVELGPGRGTLMADLLRAAGVLKGFRDALDVHLVEVSPALRETQQQTLAAAGVSVTCHSRLGDVPEGRPLLLVANEFFDALPIHQFEKSPDGWHERMIGMTPEGDGLAFGLTPPANLADTLTPEDLQAAEPGAVVEVSPPALALVSLLAERLKSDGGAALIVDYGYESPSGLPTLQALRRHARHEVLEDPGSADLTAHVDFGALCRNALMVGVEAWGPTSQGEFLKALGIEARAERLLEVATPVQAENIRSALSRLTEPEEMGAIFKVLALGAPGLGPLAGFAA